MFVNHKTVANRLFYVMGKTLRVARGLKGVESACLYLDAEEQTKARGRIRVELQSAKEWLDWSIAHLMWLETLDAGTGDLENPPKSPKSYMW